MSQQRQSWKDNLRDIYAADADVKSGMSSGVLGHKFPPRCRQLCKHNRTGMTASSVPCPFFSFERIATDNVTWDLSVQRTTSHRTDTYGSCVCFGFDGLLDRCHAVITETLLGGLHRSPPLCQIKSRSATFPMTGGLFCHMRDVKQYCCTLLDRRKPPVTTLTYRKWA